MFSNDIHVFNLSSGNTKRRLSQDSCDQQSINICKQPDADEFNSKNCDVISGPRTDPFSPYCLIPLPSQFGLGLLDSSCFRRRNERERERVRCVNEGYIRLKEHLPIENKEKRLSKVETLRCAIEYIKHLQNILQNDKGKCSSEQVFRYKQRLENNIEYERNRSDSPLKFSADGGTRSYQPESDYDMLNYSSDFTDVSSDAENFQ